MELGRELSTTSIFFHQAIAGKLGLNVTDTRCFELMSRYSQGPLTAGDLARATGLTTGAVTGILDRLEKAGLVERYRNAIDRRKVFVRPRWKPYSVSAASTKALPPPRSSTPPLIRPKSLN
jgi:DNA-binding MarR family transcriptional regulator